jgi:DNA-binding transcriptional ArsR family regulator
LQPALDFDPPVVPLPQIVRQAMGEIQDRAYDPALDRDRLNRLLDRVRVLMLDGRWRTLGEIVAQTGGGEASVSARLRDLRAAGLKVDKRRRGDARSGLFEYRVEL